MDLTSGTRVTVTTAGTTLLGGLSLTAYGAICDDVAHSVSGTCFTIVAITVIALLVIRRWVIDTSDERRHLAEAGRRAHDEYASYIALKAALLNEQGRLRQDISAEHAALNERLATERAAMQEEFELKRTELSNEAMKIAFSWVESGKVRPPERARNNLIPFPQQDQQQERAREHGVVGP